ncbi:Lsr2 family protein [Frigoribacterium sp. CFBP 13712]|nr:Lsr2 family protein [Frigoribacterium sp. CFBP 13712]
MAVVKEGWRRQWNVQQDSWAQSDPAELQKIREWVSSHRHKISDRGRVSVTVRDACNEAPEECSCIYPRARSDFSLINSSSTETA